MISMHSATPRLEILQMPLVNFCPVFHPNFQRDVKHFLVADGQLILVVLGKGLVLLGKSPCRIGSRGSMADRDAHDDSTTAVQEFERTSKKPLDYGDRGVNHELSHFKKVIQIRISSSKRPDHRLGIAPFYRPLANEKPFGQELKQIITEVTL